MKINLMEKINMVSASRCNLLSHTLPYYQTELLNYLDQSANELHKLLVILRYLFNIILLYHVHLDLNHNINTDSIIFLKR